MFHYSNSSKKIIITPTVDFNKFAETIQEKSAIYTYTYLTTNKHPSIKTDAHLYMYTAYYKEDT